MGRRADADIDSLSECDQEAHQAVNRNLGQAAAFQRAHFRLVDAKQFRRLYLGKSPLFNDLVDVAHEVRLCQHFASISEANVGKDIPAPSDTFSYFPFGIHGILPSLPSAACESRPTLASGRSEERRVGKECRSLWS